MRADLPMPEIIERYRAGEIASELAADYGTSTTTILNRLRRHGVTIRPAMPRNPRGPRRISDAKITELFNAGEWPRA